MEVEAQTIETTMTVSKDTQDKLARVGQSTSLTLADWKSKVFKATKTNNKTS